MTTPKREQEERAARFLGKLLTEDAAKLDVASDEDVQRQMDAAGVKVDRVPGVDELLARAEARAKGQGSSAESPASEAGSARVLPYERSSGPRRLSLPPRRRFKPVNVVAVLAVAALVVGVVVTNRAAIFGMGEDTSIRADDGYTPPRPPAPPSPAVRAAAMREQATVMCKQGNFEICGSLLDEAAKLDPDGEKAPAVMQERQAIEAAKPPVIGPK